MEQIELERLINELSLTYFDKPYIDKVSFNKRLRTTGGRYIPTKRLIELNPKYLAELGLDEFCGIIKHELCHYHLHIEGKGYKHGDIEFKRLLAHTGSPRHCQPLPTMNKEPMHVYACIACEQRYPRKRVLNVKKYRCGKCRGKLVKIEQ